MKLLKYIQKRARAKIVMIMFNYWETHNNSITNIIWSVLKWETYIQKRLEIRKWLKEREEYLWTTTKEISS